MESSIAVSTIVSLQALKILEQMKAEITVKHAFMGTREQKVLGT